MLLIAWSVHCCLVVTCWERADHLALFFMLNCVFVTFPCGILGQVWYLIVSIPDLYPFYYIVPCIVQYSLFMILLENIVVRQRSNFIQFIHISFKNPDLFYLTINSYLH